MKSVKTEREAKLGQTPSLTVYNWTIILEKLYQKPYQK